MTVTWRTFLEEVAVREELEVDVEQVEHEQRHRDTTRKLEIDRAVDVQLPHLLEQRRHEQALGHARVTCT